MAHIIVLGAGVGGTPAAYDLKAQLGAAHEVTLVGSSPRFQFTPSNPWVAVGWREPAQVSVDLGPHLARKGIRFVPQPATAIDPVARTLKVVGGEVLSWDYLVIATGPKLAFDEVPGSGPEHHSASICTTPHAVLAWARYQEFLKDPGPIVVGAMPGASCFGPAYEFAMILDTDLRRRKLRHKVPMTFVTPEPWVGHMGLKGVGDSKGLLEHELRERHIDWMVNAKVLEVTPDAVRVAEHDAKGQPIAERTLPQRFAAFIPAFKGVDAVAAVDGLCNPRGFVLIDAHQRSPKHPRIFAAGVCVAIPPVEVTPVPTGAPKTGYMIESMVTAICHNIEADLTGRPADHTATWNAICLADMGDRGAAFVALPQFPPRNLTWARSGRWVHWAKVAFEKYFLRKMRTGNTEPVYEKYVLRALGILRLNEKDAR